MGAPKHLLGLCALGSALTVVEVTAAEHRMAVVGGLGLTFASAYDGPGEPAAEGDGIGGYASAAYSYRFSSWLRPSAYSGLHLTKPDDCSVVGDCDVSAQFFFLGVQARLIVPIPYFAPFLESGIGGSVGQFTTRIGDLRDEETAGFARHIPLTLGALLGEHHQFDLHLRYLVHPSLDQVSGGFGVGFDFPLTGTEEEDDEASEPPPPAKQWKLQRPPGWQPDSPPANGSTQCVDASAGADAPSPIPPSL